MSHLRSEHEYPTLQLLMDAAVQASSVGEELILRPDPIPEKTVRNWWRHARSLQTEWQGDLELWRVEIEAGRPLPPTDALPVELLLAEVFVTDVLFRVWGAVLAGRDHHRFENSLGPIARNVVAAQQPIQKQALEILLTLPGSFAEVVMRIDRLRRRAERWNDLLVSPYVTKYHAAEFAHQVDVSEDFSDLPTPNPADPLGMTASKLVQAGMRLCMSIPVVRRPLVSPGFIGLLRAMFMAFPTARAVAQIEG